MTTAAFLGPVEVCIHYDGMNFSNEDNLMPFHYNDGGWVALPYSLYPEHDTICFAVESLSLFAVFELEASKHCSTLGNDPKPSLLDQDIFRFHGTKGERITVGLEADPAGWHTGRRATLIVMGGKRGYRLFKIDRSALPNEIRATLPKTGYYRVVVTEQPKFAYGEKFRGDYCIVMSSSEGALGTLEPTRWVE